MSEPRAEWAIVRQSVPVVLTSLVRRFGHFDLCEDAVQEALLAALVRWPADGFPTEPTAWLTTVASRRLTDRLRSDEARRRREEAESARALVTENDGDVPAGEDDTLTLLFLCCHPALTPPSQVALTLRAVAGLTTAEIARAYLVPEATMAQRISRAKQRVKATGATFELPDEGERLERLRAVLAVLYLLFNEGYTASSGSQLVRADLTGEAIRLTRMVHRLLPDDGEVRGLLALMLLTEARRPARTGQNGELIPLAEQDRSRWDAAAIAEGVALVTEALQTSRLGAYQLQAAIAAVYDEAPTAGGTDWPQILALYDLLAEAAPSPVVALNRAVAVGMVDGPLAGLAALDAAAEDDRIAASHRVLSARAHLLELAGDSENALVCYEEAARRTNSAPERRYLIGRAARLR